MSSKVKKGTEKFEDTTKTALVAVEPYVKPKTDKPDVEEKMDLVRKRVSRLLSRTLQENIIESYRKELPIYQNEAVL